MVNYTIREMLLQDAQKVTALEEACFTQPWKYNDFAEIPDNKDRVYLIAETDENAIIGGCMLTNIVGEGDISNVAVYSEYRGQHIAKNLMQELIKLGQKQYGITAFTLEVRSKNEPAKALYRGLGFESAGIRPNFYDKPKDDAEIMWLYIKPNDEMEEKC